MCQNYNLLLMDLAYCEGKMCIHYTVVAVSCLFEDLEMATLAVGDGVDSEGCCQ